MSLLFQLCNLILENYFYLKFLVLEYLFKFINSLVTTIQGMLLLSALIGNAMLH